MNRSIQAEGTFGVIKEDHGFRRFLHLIFKLHHILNSFFTLSLVTKKPPSGGFLLVYWFHCWE